MPLKNRKKAKFAIIGINRPWRFGAGYRSQRRKYNKARTEERMKIILDKRKSKDAKISQKLKELGIGKSTFVQYSQMLK